MAGSTQRKSSSAVFWIAIAAVLAAIPAAYFYFFERAPPPVTSRPTTTETEASAAKPLTLKLGEISGDVQIKRPGAEWQAATPGEALGADATVRTGDGSSAVLLGAEAYEVRLEPSTQVSVEEITDSLSRVLLGNGMATARVSGASKHGFEVRSQGSDSVARTRGGTFSVSNNGEGTVAVGTREGEVELLGSGKVVIVRAGQQSIVRPGSAHSEPTPIPASLLLKVRWPARNQLSTRRLLVTGDAEAGSRVHIGGKAVSVDARGHFSAPVSLTEGKNAVNVTATGVGGGQAVETRQLEVDTRVDNTQLDPDLWKK
ncbi:MAG: FecR domain-containing protein [Myxococcaceae bacterium]